MSICFQVFKSQVIGRVSRYSFHGLRGQNTIGPNVFLSFTFLYFMVFYPSIS